MLTEQEKQELLEDAFNIKRRASFARAGQINHGISRSLDDYIKSLMNMQRVFGPFHISMQKPVTKNCKL